MAIYYAVKRWKKKKQEREEANNPPMPDLEQSSDTAPHLPGEGGPTQDEAVDSSGSKAAPVSDDKKKSEKPKAPELSPEEIAEKKRKRAYRWKVLLGLVLPFTLQALDMTIVASALPFIATDFSELCQEAQ
jgi:hypothetical protein